MKTKSLIALVIFAVSFYHFKKKESAPRVVNSSPKLFKHSNKRISKVSQLTIDASEHVVKKNENVNALKGKETLMSASFDDKVSSIIYSVKDDVNIERAKESFKSIDSIKNYNLSLEIVKMPYGQIVSTGEAKQKILALMFLARTGYLTKRECSRLAGGVVRQYEQANENQKWALLWDTSMLAEACVPIAKEELFRIAKSAPPKLALQFEELSD